MKTLIFCILFSIFLHISLGGFVSLWTERDRPSEPEIVDLTLTPLPQNITTPLRLQSKPRGSQVAFNKGTSSTKTAQTITADDNSNDGDPLGSEEVAATSFSELTRLPKVLKEVKAKYPEEAKLARVDGAVVLDIVIGRDGKVSSVTLVRGPGYGLNESAMEALKSFEFIPAQKSHLDVPVKIRYTYRFKLGIN